MRGIGLALIVLLSGFMAKPAETDSLLKELNRLQVTEQLNIISRLSFNYIVENSQSLIPILLKYEGLAIEEKKFKILAKIYENLSLAYYYRGKYDENLKYGLRALRLYDSLNLKSEMGTMYGELGYQMKYRDLTKAFELMRKGIYFLEQLKNPEPLAKIYDNYGVLHELNNQIDSALFYYRKSFAIKRSRADSIGIPYSLNNFFMAYMLINKYDSAYKYLEESTRIRLKTNDILGLAENYSYFGQFYSARADYSKAIQYNLKSLEIASKHNYTNLVKSAYNDLSVCYEKSKDYKSSLKYHKLFAAIQDSLINLETNKTIADLQVQYETAEKEKELIRKNEQLEKERTLKSLIIVIAIVTILATMVFFWNKQLIAQRNEKIKLQMALIEGEQAERNRIAMELHDGIANDINAVIMSFNNCLTGNRVISNEDIEKLKGKLGESHQNVRKLSHSLMPRSLHQNGLKVALGDLCLNFSSSSLSISLQTIGLEERLPAFIELNTFRIVQEAINNIIKHSGASSVQIECNRFDNQLLLSIEDNGVGFSGELTKETSGLGVQSIKNRVQLMNGKISINSAENQGTSIDIQIPLKS